MIARNVFTFGGGTIVWRSINQTCVVHSTMEAEHVATSEAAKEVVWLRKFLKDLAVVRAIEMPLTMFFNNMKPLQIPRKHKFIREGM